MVGVVCVVSGVVDKSSVCGEGVWWMGVVCVVGGSSVCGEGVWWMGVVCAGPVEAVRLLRFWPDQNLR